MLAIPILVIGIALAPFGAMGYWVSITLCIVANLLLWGAMAIGFYVNVYTPWRLGKATPADEGSKTSNQPSGASFKATESPNRASREIKDTLQ